MKEELQQKVRQYFSAMSIYKDPNATNSIFAGRNLPSFVKDYLLKRFLNISTGEVDTKGLSAFLDKVIPANGGSVKDDILSGKEVTLLARFTIYIDLVKGEKQLPFLIMASSRERELYLIISIVSIPMNWWMGRSGV